MLRNETGGAKMAIIAFACGIMLISPMLWWDYEEPEYPDLKKAVQVVRYISSPDQIEQYSFLDIEGEKSPSQFVRWMFSTLGTAEWFVQEDSTEFSPDELSEAQRTAAVMPKNVSLFPNRAKPGRKKQVVVKSDDQRGMIIVEAYLNPRKSPAFVREWPFPQYEN